MFFRRAEIARLAVGTPAQGRAAKRFACARRHAEEHIEGLPLGTRGGAVFSHHVSADGESIESPGGVRLGCAGSQRAGRGGRQENHERRAKCCSIANAWRDWPRSNPPGSDKTRDRDRHLEFRVAVRRRTPGVTFIKIRR